MLKSDHPSLETFLSEKNPDGPSPGGQPNVNEWQFAGWGSAKQIKDLGDEPIEVTSLDASEKHKLGEWGATAICGNDITSSCLYVAALSIGAAAWLAPVALLLVAAVLYLFRRIYAEVGSALPLNGGTYTLLLNCTNKKAAAAAACLTLLSYMATAVISAGEAMHYLHHLEPNLNILVATIILLGFFAFLNLMGISESAKVALGIFIFHMLTLAVLCVICIVGIIKNPADFVANWQLPLPNGDSVLHALFFGFAFAMLGISGFESSANFIEEQRKGVFPKTLRNMWIAVSVFNPLICLLVLGFLKPWDIEILGWDFKEGSEEQIEAFRKIAETAGMTLAEAKDHAGQLKHGFLAVMGERAGGGWLGTWITVDAVLVLSGAVLTSYVGVIGLVRRMALDRCLPQLLLRQNRWRHTNHWIILGFFGLCCAVLFVTLGSDGNPDTKRLAGVYTLSFLAVMFLFALGNGMLKVVRSRLPRAVRARWPGIVLAAFAVAVGLAGNINIPNVEIFLTFFFPVMGAIFVMFFRVHIMRVALFISQSIVEPILGKIKEINEMTVVYFTRGDDMVILNRAALYVLQNEQTQRLKVVHVHHEGEEVPADLAKHLEQIDHLYPQLRIDFIAVEGAFGPELIERLSKRLNVPKNYMFIGTPSHKFPHDLADLGGVRLIL